MAIKLTRSPTFPHIDEGCIGRLDFDGVLIVLIFAAQFAVAMLAIADGIVEAPDAAPIAAAMRTPAA